MEKQQYATLETLSIALTVLSKDSTNNLLQLIYKTHVHCGI
jgi:hypothetical protein